MLIWETSQFKNSIFGNIRKTYKCTFGKQANLKIVFFCMDVIIFYNKRSNENSLFLHIIENCSKKKEMLLLKNLKLVLVQTNNRK